VTHSRPLRNVLQPPRYAKLILNPCQHTAFAAHRVKTFSNKGYTQFGQVYSVFQKYVNKFTIFKSKTLLRIMQTLALIMKNALLILILAVTLCSCKNDLKNQIKVDIEKTEIKKELRFSLYN